ncbi:2-succinylbenzoate--CoA ligase, chloroplastic/peroxisomal [Porphyridium purpureum]|uniref:2-succinylbenzoate--CoA ligase, chloroplastic/peroxisomal n=1 Tax=Porphyridium purpureum TaxID=35688 RepID=A0A5J4Z7Z4_PORPP|nr:2-succinylbenzoate--CoA ligase, chloroplastic/peroxisomal [Porphyridium purpureum]|eukprot:POR5824..scf295_1
MAVAMAAALERFRTSTRIEHLLEPLRSDGDAPGLYFEDGGHTVSYAELERHVLRVAAKLRLVEKGLADRSLQPLRVALLGYGDSPTYIQLLFAVPLCEYSLVLLNARWSVNEIARALQTAHVAVLVYEGGLLAPEVADELLQGGKVQPVCIPMQYFASLDGSQLLGSEMTSPTRNIQHAREYNQSEFGVFFTSGTSSEAKGAILTHENMLVQALAKCEVLGYNASTRYLHLAPLYHVGGMNSFLAVVGARGVHIVPSARSRSESDQIRALIHRYDVNTLVVVPAIMFRMLGGKQSQDDNHGRDSVISTSMHTLLFGGNALDHSLLAATCDAFPHARVYEAFGMTEAASSLTFTRGHKFGEEYLPGGFAPRHVELGIMDLETTASEPLSDLHVFPYRLGEIWTRGPQMFYGYCNQSTKREKDEWFATGDMGFFTADGALVLAGRKKDMIKSGGENVFAAEVEEVLMRDQEMILECAVVGVKDARLGEAVCAVLVVASGRDAERPTLEMLQEHCTRHGLSRFKVPRYIHFCASLPRNPNGKVLKRTLIEQLQLCQIARTNGGRSTHVS